MNEAVVADAVRTPIGGGKPGGALSGVRPVDPHAHAIGAPAERMRNRHGLRVMCEAGGPANAAVVERLG